MLSAVDQQCKERHQNAEKPEQVGHGGGCLVRHLAREEHGWYDLNSADGLVLGKWRARNEINLSAACHRGNREPR